MNEVIVFSDIFIFNSLIFIILSIGLVSAIGMGLEDSYNFTREFTIKIYILICSYIFIICLLLNFYITCTYEKVHLKFISDKDNRYYYIEESNGDKYSIWESHVESYEPETQMLTINKTFIIPYNEK